jgi:hypothetical protein
MRSDRAAHSLLSLFLPSERASAIVGDLLEDTSVRPLRFWTHVAGTAASSLGYGVVKAPFSMYAGAGLGWFVYMFASLGLILVGWLLATVLWGLLYVFSNHTGLELLVDLLRVRLDWPPLPDALGRTVEIVAMWAVAPFWFGVTSARHWRGSEVVSGIVVALVWQLMAILVPFAAFFTRATFEMMPVIGASVLAGTVWARLDSLRHARLTGG